MDLIQSFDVAKVGYMSKKIVEIKIKFFEKKNSIMLEP
jgi:hypothetical protein